MNFEVNKIKIDEVEISIKNIIAQCIRKWKMTLVCGVIFAILISGLMYVKDAFTYNSVLAGELTEVQIEEWTEEDQVAVDTYKVLQQKVDQLEEYRDHSIYINLDFNNVNYGILTYHVDADAEVKYDITSVIANYVNNGGLAKALSEEDGYPEEKYIQEIISADVAGTLTGIESGVVTISVMGASEAECAEYVDSIKQAIGSYSKSLQADVKAFSLSTIEEEYVVKSVPTLYTAQQTYLTECTTAELEYTSKLSSLTDVQKAYIVGNSKGEEIDFEEKLQVSKPKIKPVFVIIGAVLGVLVALVTIACITIFSGKIQTEKELLKRLNVCHLGNVYYMKNSGIEKLIHKMLYKSIGTDVDVQLNTVCTRLSIVLKNASSKKVYLLGTSDTITGMDAESWSKVFQKQGIECVVIGNVLDAQEEVGKLVADENVVLVENIGKTRIKDVYEEATLCMDAKVKVVGYISVYA